MNTFSRLLSAFLLISFSVFLTGCGEDDPVKEDIPELITKATLTFTPTSGSVVVVSATDPDGEGAQSIKVDGAINLAKGVTYTLSILLINELAQPTDVAYNVSAEVEEEGDEHQFYYSWSDGVFSDPAGNGNIDNRADKVNYIDKDESNLPIGLTTEWKTAATSQTAKSFRVVLKHQPDLKSTTSSFADGETDLDVLFTINVN